MLCREVGAINSFCLFSRERYSQTYKVGKNVIWIWYDSRSVLQLPHPRPLAFLQLGILTWNECREGDWDGVSQNHWLKFAISLSPEIALFICMNVGIVPYLLLCLKILVSLYLHSRFGSQVVKTLCGEKEEKECWTQGQFKNKEKRSWVG